MPESRLRSDHERRGDPRPDQVLWQAERFDRIVVPAPTGRRHGFAPKDLTWMLTHAPSETLILRPDPALGSPNGNPSRRHGPPTAAKAARR